MTAAPAPRITEASPLILASGSRYRAELLRRLRIPFVAIASSADETPQPGESPATLALRLAQAKAQTLAASYPQRWILGSDQVASCQGQLLHKPGHRAAAVAQLQTQSGQRVSFHTAVALLGGDTVQTHLDHTQVQFRELELAEIERYVDAEPAYDCAGAFQCEAYGISLLARIDSVDPTALIGLPLMAVRHLLAAAGCPRP